MLIVNILLNGVKLNDEIFIIIFNVMFYKEIYKLI